MALTKTKRKTVLASTLTMGAVGLHVKELEMMGDFYRNIIGLDLIKADKNHILLGFGSEPIVNLIRSDELSPAERTSAGLYHIAILFSSRRKLAQTIYTVVSKTPYLFSGSADHLVSEAFYLNDPEGNGIELYFDKDKTTWKWTDNGIMMDSIYLDPAVYITKYLSVPEEKNRLRTGHVHLKVGDIEKAKKFYADTLGFDITAELPGALFVSAGGYHHHVGLNTWESAGAEKRKKSLGLAHYELILPSDEDLMSLRHRLAKNGYEFTEKDGTLNIHDPWDNLIVAKRSS